MYPHPCSFFARSSWECPLDAHSGGASSDGPVARMAVVSVHTLCTSMERSRCRSVVWRAALCHMRARSSRCIRGSGRGIRIGL